jgi:hypothetical protein
MNLKSTIRCTLLFLSLADGAKSYLRGRQNNWSAISFLELGSGFNAIPEPIASGEPNPGKPACPIGNRGFVKCPEDYEPVLCDGVCVYDNLCSAEAGPGFTEEDCEKVIEPEDQPNEDQPNPGKSMCPHSDLTGDGCPEIYTPVSCDDCIYANICFAKAASFLETDCEKVMGQKDQSKPVPNDALPVNPTQIDVDCPAPDADVACIHMFAPVMCDGNCYYSNSCLAAGAGFADAKCEPLEEPETEPGSNTIAIGELNPATPCRIGDSGIVPCPLIFAPVVCGGLCKYDTFCSAQAAGYVEEECTPNTVGQPAGQPTDTEEAIEIKPETPGMEIPGFPPVSIINETEEASSTYPANDTPGMIIPAPGDPVASSGTNESGEASSGTSDSSSETPGMEIPGGAPVSSINETKVAYSAYPAKGTPGMIIPVPGNPTVVFPSESEEASSNTNESEEASSGTGDSRGSSSCPGIGSEVICAAIWDPVFCGPDQCMYGNLCSGVSAGFLEADCEAAR